MHIHACVEPQLRRCKVLELDERTLKPVFTERDTTFIWIRVNNIYIVSIARGNPNVVLVLDDLARWSFLLNFSQLCIFLFNVTF